jgi:hypothetical protein
MMNQNTFAAKFNFFTGIFKSNRTVRLVAVALIGFAGSARADDNLLTNPGFETGSFSGWNVVGPFLGIQGGHNSTYSAYCGAGPGDNGTTGDLFSQTIPTTVGLNYDVSLWVVGTSGGNGNNYILWDGARVLDEVNQNFGDWTQIEVRVEATSASSTVGFGFVSNNSYNFDDASVALATPEPSTLAIGGLAVAGLAFWRRKK